MRTGGDDLAGEVGEVRRDGTVDEGVAPLVEGDPLGQQLRAQAPGPTGRPVDLQPELGPGAAAVTRRPRPVPRTGTATRQVRLDEAREPVDERPTRRVVPSGWAQAPRPVDEAGHLGDPGAGVGPRCEVPHRGGECRQPVAAGPAPTGRLPREVCRELGRACHRAAARAERQHDPRAEGQARARSASAETGRAASAPRTSRCRGSRRRGTAPASWPASRTSAKGTPCPTSTTQVGVPGTGEATVSRWSRARCRCRGRHTPRDRPGRAHRAGEGLRVGQEGGPTAVASDRLGLPGGHGQALPTGEQLEHRPALSGDEAGRGSVPSPADPPVTPLAKGCLDPGGRGGAVGGRDDVHLARGEGPGGEDGAVEHLVRGQGEQHEVLGTGRLALGSVDDDHGTAAARDRLELAGEGEARPAPAPHRGGAGELEQRGEGELRQCPETGGVGRQPGPRADPRKQQRSGADDDLAERSDSDAVLVMPGSPRARARPRRRGPDPPRPRPPHSSTSAARTRTGRCRCRFPARARPTGPTRRSS